MGAYGSPEFLDYIQRKNENREKPVRLRRGQIICPHCGKTILIKPTFGPFRFLAWAFCILLALIILVFGIIVFYSAIQVIF